ncbi:hypothetical protein HYH03_005806 [Edaphochlamys debaryana]|uniref:Uncharacterized protein n=1 Tax=Edaphochlamys debaryana TaxID=47281 RepID=A0A835Y6Z6_9CHLO|nr:hypothetical protein HYH03_005806 [Edaphochlamys debaryana]|eukprot:KAG2496207.1 hypothetical protein HYH03_005806 [Edaphochlamys debaryana]
MAEDRRVSSGSGASSAAELPQPAPRQPPQEVCDAYIQWMQGNEDEPPFECTEDDPGMIIDYDDAALAARRTNVPVAQSRAEIADCVANHMARAVGLGQSQSEKFFRGSLAQWADAQSALGYLDWARAKPGQQPPVAALWQVSRVQGISSYQCTKS